jgi:hypothetical protein
VPEEQPVLTASERDLIYLPLSQVRERTEPG